MPPGQAHATVAAHQRDDLIDDRAPPPDVRRDSRASHPHLRKRAEPEDEAGPEDDVEDVAEPEHAHGDRGVSCAAENGVDQEEQHDRHVPAEHDARERAARLDDVGCRAHQPQQVRRARRRQQRNQRRDDDAEDDRLRCGARRAFGILLADASRHERHRADRQPHRERVDHRQHRLGEPDGRDRIGAEVRDPEDVGDGEDRLHRHLHHHRHGEHDHRAPDRRGRVVDRRPADRVAERGPDAVVCGRCRRGDRSCFWNERHCSTTEKCLSGLPRWQNLIGDKTYEVESWERSPADRARGTRRGPARWPAGVGSE